MTTAKKPNRKKLFGIVSLACFAIYALLRTSENLIIGHYGTEGAVTNPTASAISGIMMFIGLIAPIAFASIAYVWLRKRHFGNDVEVLTAGAVTLGVCLASIFADSIRPYIVGESIGLANVIMLNVFSAVITALLAIFGAHLGRGYYSRKHSVVVD